VTTALAQTNDDPLAGLSERLPRPRLPAAYLLGLLLVSVGMIVLPLLYLALVAASAWAVYWWATHGFAMLFHGSVSGTNFRVIAYLGPLVCGGAVPLFLVKPLFARRPAPPGERYLERKDQPLLFRFIERLASVVGAPAPDRIVLDCQVNAGAGLELGLLRREGTALVLSIGLPLVAGLTLPQLANVLAHEFGHFGQGAGMRLGRVIRAVNLWFQRVVYERDDWDEALATGREGEGWWAIACFGAQVLVGLGRRILYGLMVAGHGMSCYLSRQMEFDADQYGARVAGSAVFADTSLRVRVLAAAADFVMSSMLSERFVDDLPALVTRVADQAPARLMTAIRMDVQRSGTGLFDTHPSDLERLRRARAGRFPGVLAHHGPATALFRDFPGVCRRATLELYEASLGAHAPGVDALLPVDAFVAPAAPRPAEGPAPLEFPHGRGPRLAAHVAPVRDGVDTARIDAVRQRLRAASPAATEASGRFDRARDQAFDAAQAEALLGAGLAVRPQDFSLPAASLEGVERTRSRARTMQAEADRDLEPVERALAERIGLALGALETGATDDSAALGQEARDLLQALPALERAQVQAEALRCEAVVMNCLLGNQRDRMGHAGLDKEIDRRLSALRLALTAVRTATEGLTLEGWSWDVPPPWRDDPASHLKSATRALEIVEACHVRVIDRLLEITARVEAPATAEGPRP
jgi:Zn-dependent protease with chaperone function